MALKKAWKAFENLLPMLLGIIIIVGIIIAILDPQLIGKLIGNCGIDAGTDTQEYKCRQK